MTDVDLRIDYQRAEDLALALAEARVDPNEAQKALAYLRSRGRGQALFEYLGAAVRDGRAVVRSNRTLGYYREILSACERYLRPLQRDYELLVRTYALALRLLRYYRAVPPGEHMRFERLPAAPGVRPETEPAEAPVQSRPLVSPPPAVPDEPARPFDARLRGAVLRAAAPGLPGVVEDADGRQFGYDLDDVIGAPPGERGVVRFRPDKKKVQVGKEKKLRPWAFAVEAEAG